MRIIKGCKLILLMLIGFSSYAQPGSRVVYSSKFIKAPGFIADSSFTPPSDTTNYKSGFAVKNGVAYIGNGTYWAAIGSSGTVSWGDIVGDIDTQSDLFTALNLKLNIADTASMMKRDTTSAYLLSNFNTSNTTATNTGLKFQIAANEIYRITITGTVSKATSTTGLKIAIGAPTGCTIKAINQVGATTLAAAMANTLITAVNTLGATFSAGAGVEVPFRVEGVVTNGANAGVIELQVATVTSNAATVYAGTSMTWQRTKGL